MRTPGECGRLRVAVVTTEGTRPEANELWTAAASQIGDLLTVVARDGRAEIGPGTVALRQVDARLGLVWRHLIGLRKTIRAFHPDLVHVNGELWGLTVQETVSSVRPVVAHGAENLWEHGGSLERRARRRLVKRAIRHTSGYASWNGAGAAHVTALAAPGYPTLVLPAVVPSREFRRAVWVGPRPGQEFTVLLVGRLTPVKGFDTAIRAVAALQADVDARIVVAGVGSLESALRRLAAQLDVRVEFAGELKSADLAALMTTADCLVQPSVTLPDNAEQFGRAVAEAMTVGVPVLVSDSGELPHVASTPQGVFAEGDEVQLRGLLHRVAFDPSFVQDLVRQQAHAATRYEPRHAARAMIEFWTRALDFAHARNG